MNITEAFTSPEHRNDLGLLKTDPLFCPSQLLMQQFGGQVTENTLVVLVIHRGGMSFSLHKDVVDALGRRLVIHHEILSESLAHHCLALLYKTAYGRDWWHEETSSVQTGCEKKGYLSF